MYKWRASFLYCLTLLALVFLSCGCNDASPRYQGQEIPEERSAAKSSSIPNQAAHPADLPSRLIISSIQVDAPIETVGVLANGDLDTPEKSPWTHVGWYDSGPVPGERGSAVIDGHLDRPGGLPAVFWNLRNMRVGDSVVVIMSSGKKRSFHVTRIAAYPPTSAPLQAIFGDVGGFYLNLITCAGDWIPSQHQTTQRMVVYTTLSKN